MPAAHTSIIRAALILSADHEFNASAFAARVVASTGANLYGATMAGLAAINGPRHGGLTRRVAALFDDVRQSPDLETELANRLRARVFIPGFGHPLYPDGDIRAATLFAVLSWTEGAIGESFACPAGVAGFLLKLLRSVASTRMATAPR